MAKIENVGFIGLGIMGVSMAGHIQAGGYKLHVYNRTKSKADPLVAKGAVWHGSPAEVAKVSDCVVTIVGYPKDVEEVYLGPQGVVANAKPGAYLIDMTTSTPALARKIEEAAKARGLHALDAPVTGGDVGAREGKLAIMVGGDKADFEAVKPILERMGNNIAYMGAAGNGQHAKAVNQILVGACLNGVAEGLAYAKKAGLDVEAGMAVWANGLGSSRHLTASGPRMLKHDYAAGFFVHHFIKDMTVALAEAKGMGLELPIVEAIKKRYEQLAKAGGEQNGVQGIFQLYDK